MANRLDSSRVLWPLGRMVEPLAPNLNVASPVLTDDLVRQFADEFLRLSESMLEQRDFASGLGCRDFTECLHEACNNGQSVSNDDARRARDMWLKTHQSTRGQLQNPHHILTFAKHMANKLAPFFCKGPPLVPMAVEVKAHDTVPQSSSACVSKRVMEAEAQTAWWGVFGAAVLIILTIPVRFEFKLSEYLFSIYPSEPHKIDIT